MFEDGNGDWHPFYDAKYVYKVGEIVAVAQSYKNVACGALFDDLKEAYRTEPTKLAGWINKMFVRADLMPHQIRITSVRVERLQDISDEGCIKEGLVQCDDEICKTKCYLIPECRLFHCGNGCEDPREAYAALIDRIAGKGTWESNPWVFVYDFEHVK